MQKIGRYEVIDELGRGAMGVVYRARDTQIGRIVALKVILTANASPEDIERYKLRFRREAQAAGRLSHPGIVTIHDIAEDESGQPYLVMEYIEGRPLNLYLGPTAQVSLDTLLDLGIQVAMALDYAHRSGIVHRDIKPPNILVTSEGRAKIADFGIARMEGTELTQEGTSVGTPSYMSPEQFRGGEIDGRSDIFSLGAVLYWMFTGEKPFTGETVTRISFQVAFEAPTPASVVRTGLPPSLDEILSRCMAKSADARYASGAELAADLAAARAGKPLPARPSLPVERTVPLPLSPGGGKPRQASVEDSDPNAQTRVGVAATGSRTQPLQPAVHRRFPPGLILLAGVLLAAAAAGGYWRLQNTPASVPAVTIAGPQSTPTARAPGAASSAAPEGQASPGSGSGAGGSVNASSDRAASVAPAPRRAPASAPDAGQPANSVEGAPAAGATAPAETTAPPSAAPAETSEGVADATLEIICNHHFKQATLEIFLDGRPFFTGALEGKRKALTLGMTRGGRLEAKKHLPGGRHTIRVLVKSPEDLYQDETSITETIAAHAVRTLKINFGEEGSGPNGGRKVHADLY